MTNEEMASVVEAAVKRAMRQQPLSTMNMAEVCQLLHIQRNAVYRRIRQGLLHPKKVGGRVLFVRQEIESLIK